MSNGKQIRLLSKTTFDKMGNGLIASTGQAGTTVAANVDISGYLYGSLVLRLHSWTIATGAPVIWVSSYASAPTAEDPAVTYRSSTPLIDGSSNGIITYASAILPQFTTIGTEFNGTTGSAGFMDVVLFLKQGSTASSAATFTVSVDLVLRS